MNWSAGERRAGEQEKRRLWTRRQNHDNYEMERGEKKSRRAGEAETLDQETTSWQL
jgi:hypothetical protein